MTCLGNFAGKKSVIIFIITLQQRKVCLMGLNQFLLMKGWPVRRDVKK